MTSAVDFAIRSLDDELSSFDRTLDTTRSQRQIAVDKANQLMARVDVASIDITDPKAVDSVGRIVSTTLKALDSVEASAQRSVNAKLRHDEQKKTSAVSDQVVELLKRVSAGEMAPPESMAISLDAESESITQSLIEGGISILPTELRVDSDDLLEDKQ